MKCGFFLSFKILSVYYKKIKCPIIEKNLEGN